MLLHRLINFPVINQLSNIIIKRNLHFLGLNHRNYPAISKNNEHNLTLIRFKSKKSKARKSSDSESDELSNDLWENKLTDKSTKILNVNVNSTRVDALLKAGLGMARNKIETLFYESKIRLNGEKVLKKSIQAQEGDEIDIIKGPSPTNPDYLIVARVEVLNVRGEGENISAKLRRCKTLTIENYEKIE